MKNSKSFFLVFLVLIFSCTPKKAKDFKPTKTLKTILKDKKLEQRFSNFRIDNVYLFTGIEKRESFMKFSQETNVDDLILFMECEKPIIRCFAFKILAEKNYAKIRELLSKHINDNDLVEIYRGHCIRMETKVKLYMLEQLSPFSHNDYRFSKSEHNKIYKDFSN
jgi:hypothetical protein